MSRFCGKCGCSLPEAAQFCGACGTLTDGISLPENTSRGVTPHSKRPPAPAGVGTPMPDGLTSIGAESEGDISTGPTQPTNLTRSGSAGPRRGSEIWRRLRGLPMNSQSVGPKATHPSGPRRGSEIWRRVRGVPVNSQSVGPGAIASPSVPRDRQTDAAAPRTGGASGRPDEAWLRRAALPLAAIAGVLVLGLVGVIVAVSTGGGQQHPVSAPRSVPSTSPPPQSTTPPSPTASPSSGPSRIAVTSLLDPLPGLQYGALFNSAGLAGFRNQIASDLASRPGFDLLAVRTVSSGGEDGVLYVIAPPGTVTLRPVPSSAANCGTQPTVALDGRGVCEDNSAGTVLSWGTGPFIVRFVSSSQTFAESRLSR